MTDYAAVIRANYPGSEYVLVGDTYDGLTWLSDTPKPTQAELDAAWPAVQQAQAQAAVDAQRHAAYVTESDPLFFQWQAGEITEQEWLDKRAEIKTRYPNPGV
jgi:hypothetical protein